MPNFNKLFTLDSETIDILKNTSNQSKTVRDAVKSYHKKQTIKEKPQNVKPIVEDVE